MPDLGKAKSKGLLVSPSVHLPTLGGHEHSCTGNDPGLVEPEAASVILPDSPQGHHRACNGEYGPEYYLPYSGGGQLEVGSQNSAPPSGVLGVNRLKHPASPQGTGHEVPEIQGHKLKARSAKPRLCFAFPGEKSK